MILVQIYLFSLRYSQSSKFTIYILESITESVHIYKYGCTIRREWLFHIEKNLKSLGFDGGGKVLCYLDTYIRKIFLKDRRVDKGEA